MKNKSIFARLILIFLLAGIALVLSSTIPFKLISDQSGRAFFKNNLLEYTELIVNRYKENENYKNELLEKTKLKIIKVNSSELEEYLSTNFKHIRLKKVSDNIYFEKRFRKTLVIFKESQNTYLITNKKEISDYNMLSLIITIILCLIILVLTYKAVTSLFSPVKDILFGVGEYSKGNFGYDIPVKGNTQFSDIATYLNDISQQIKNKLEERNALLMAIAHELKTPLASARINAELINTSEPLEKIKIEISEIDKLLNTIIEINREIHFDKNILEDFDISEILRNYENVDIHYEAKKLLIDPIKMSLVIQNIIENTKKYGNSQLEIFVKKNEIVFRDFGPGVQEGNISNITQPFYRESSSRTRGEGYGLGLYLVEKLANAQDFKLILENAHPGLRVILRKG